MSDDLNAHFYCPITSELMTDPVIDADGNTFERSAIEQWLQMHGTSPLTRNAMRASDLTPNRALRQAIEEERGKSNVPVSLAAARGAQIDSVIVPIVGAGAVAAAAAAVVDNAIEPLRISIALSAPLGDADAEGGVEVLAMASIAQSPHVVGARVPSDIVLAIDVSGSMNSQAVAQGAEDSLLSTLDIVKHAIRTVLHTAGELDRVALITYADSAKVVCDLTVMNAAGRARALSLVDTMVAAGRTNLWDGLLKSLQVLDTAEKQADTIAGGAEGAAAGAAPVSPLFLTRRNASIMLLTDGEPNIEPPRGHLPTLRRYMEQRGGRLPAVLSTFGFGYSLDSHLLRELAVAGGGMYSFIPDSGFVGTVFVHALAHSLVSIGHHARLELQSVVHEDSAAAAAAAPAAPVVLLDVVLLDDELLVNAGHAARIGAPAGAGAQPSLVLSIGSVQSEQPLHALVRMRLPAPAIADRPDGGGLVDPARAVFRAALSYRPSQGRRARVAGGSDDVTVRTSVSAADAAAAFQRASVVGVGAPPAPLSGVALEVEAQRLRLMLINTLQRACNFMEVHDASGATQVLDATITHMREWLSRNPEQRAGAAVGSGLGSGGGMLARLSSLGAASGAGSEVAAASASPHVRVRAMLADLTGQVTEAVSRQDWFHKWGRHYLPSLQRAHELETCHNFKDKSVQHYGGAAFSDVRDAADDIFSNLPAPVPSGGHPPPPPMAGMAPAAAPAAPGGGRGGYAPVNMRAYNNAGAGCVHADSLIRLADGSHVRARDVQRGMRVAGSNGGVGRVRCVMVSECVDSKARLYRVGGGLRVTGWHPVRMVANGSEPAWRFPCHVGEAIDEACDAVYSFLVERALPIEGASCHDDAAPFADSDALLESDMLLDSLDASHASWPWADHVVADGVDTIALAHGIRDDAVAAHAFWGTCAVADALRQCAGWAQGRVRFGAHSQWVQRSRAPSKTAAGVDQHDEVVGFDASAAMAAQ